LKGRYTFFVFNEVYLSYFSNVYRACSFFTNLDFFCIDNARVIYRKIGKCSFFTNLDLFCIDNARVIYRKIRYLIPEIVQHNAENLHFFHSISRDGKYCLYVIHCSYITLLSQSARTTNITHISFPAIHKWHSQKA